MKSFVIKGMGIALASMLFMGAPASAKELKASLAQMPVYAESMDKGILVDLVKLIEKESGVTIHRDVVPFARSMDNVIKRQINFHMPLIMVPNADESKQPNKQTTKTKKHNKNNKNTNKRKPHDASKLASYKLETDRAHTQYFPFPIEPSAGLESSLKKLDAGRIDGFIFADFASDPIIKQNSLKNIHRSLYKVFDVKIILQKGARGGEVDKLLA